MRVRRPWLLCYHKVHATLWPPAAPTRRRSREPDSCGPPWELAGRASGPDRCHIAARHGQAAMTANPGRGRAAPPGAGRSTIRCATYTITRTCPSPTASNRLGAGAAFLRQHRQTTSAVGARTEGHIEHILPLPLRLGARGWWWAAPRGRASECTLLSRRHTCAHGLLQAGRLSAIFATTE